MKHILTVQHIRPDVLRDLEDRRLPVNSRSSRLSGLVTLFLEQLKKANPCAMLHQSDTRHQETYSASLGEYAAKLTVLLYHSRDTLPSMVAQSQSVLQIYQLRNHLALFSDTADFDTHEKLYDIASKAFVVCGATCVFCTDIDEGIWSIWFDDLKNRTTACLEFTHQSLIAKSKQMVK